MQQNRDKNDHNYAPPKQIIAQIKTTKMCMQQIQEICPRRKYKSCLSFAPSSVQHISILSGESPTQRFRGFINLIAIFFVVLNLRNIIDNFLFYGARFTNTPLQFIPLESIIGFCLMFLFIEFAYFVDRLRFGKIIKESLAV